MKQFWPLNIEPLPLPDAPADEGSEDYSIYFREGDYGVIQAQIYDERKFLVDVITAHSFTECYKIVAEEYPQARWNPEGGG